jgi:hypothetical protein
MTGTAPGDDSLRSWLVARIRAVLDRRTTPAPLLLWSDPRREWLELLRAASAHDGFDLWAPARASEAEHELVLRDRFVRSERRPRVVWLPVAESELSWFQVVALEAEAVWTRSLVEALRDYGVSVPAASERTLVPLLPQHARAWFERPRSSWAELTPGTAKGTLVDDDRVLEALAGPRGDFERLCAEDRFEVFAARAVEDFGLPDPRESDEPTWRVAATARLLATEAAQACPDRPPAEAVVPRGPARDNALRLLKAWQSHVDRQESFEALSQAADATLGLAWWARNLPTPPRSFGSRAVEEALFQQAVERLERVQDVRLLAEELERGHRTFEGRLGGFWTRHARVPVGWAQLVDLARMASLLVEHAGAESRWTLAGEAIEWYAAGGWRLDARGEGLFTEPPDLPAPLQRIRALLQRGYLRAVDQIGGAFSHLLAARSDEVLALPTTGEVCLAELDGGKPLTTPTALVFLDACRYELGQRLADLLNEGETARRATVKTAVARVPSVTALGMAFALPLPRGQLQVGVTGDGRFQVSAEGFRGNLALAQDRARWLAERFGVQDLLSVADVLDGEKLASPTRKRRLVVVCGAEFDHEGHEGQLQWSGADAHLERYARAIRRLRDAGYARVVVVTDHGFFHWRPDADEIEDRNVTGEEVWRSRRAVVGRGLAHGSAVRLPVPGSDLDVLVPRSVNAFRAYGGLGYFHGGATLQEIVIPVLTVRWPVRAAKVGVVLKPVSRLVSLSPSVEVQAAATAFEGQSRMLDDRLLPRRVTVKVRNAETGAVVFRHGESVTIEPGGETQAVRLSLVEPRPAIAYGARLFVEVADADDETLLAREEVELKVDIDEW